MSYSFRVRMSAASLETQIKNFGIICKITDIQCPYTWYTVMCNKQSSKQHILFVSFETNANDLITVI